MMFSRSAGAALAALMLSSSLTQAQTPTLIPTPPVPASIVAQAKAQAEGRFTSMKRSGIGGQIQDAWDGAKSTDGVFSFQYCRDCASIW